MGKKSKSEYDLFKYYVDEYMYIKKRLKSMEDFKNNPVHEDEEYINILLEDNEELKNENIKLRLEISNMNLFNELPWYKKLIYILTKKI